MQDSPIPQIDLYTDGACSGNPGPGGFAAILKTGAHEKVITGGDAHTTNNRMELLGVIEGLKALNKPCVVTVHTDSKYVADAVQKGWAKSWQQNGWKKADKKPALNVDLWEQLLSLLDTHQVNFHWIKGHAGHPENERCDKLAVLEIEKYRKV